MNNNFKKYQSELDSFREAFDRYKDKRIVLYGIGRYTATLTGNIRDFRFVGLMDKNPANIGKELFGLPIVDVKTAESIADIVIINTSETYWSVIYERIQKIKIPVYYKNGVRASRKKCNFKENIFRDLSYKRLKEQIAVADVVSFDFFDTIFMRKVCNPRDVFLLLQKEFENEWGYGSDYSMVRDLAIEKAGDNYTLEELYDQIKVIAGLSDELTQRIYKREIELEKNILCPRDVVIEAVRYASDSGKEVYIVTDMYLPRSFFIEAFCKYNVLLDEKNIIISSEQKKSKVTGDIWELLKECRQAEDKVLHIGDNISVDVKLPRQYSIATSYVPNVWDMLKGSSLAPLCANITTEYASLLTGCVLPRLFADPYGLSKAARPVIDNNKDMGYCVFGPAILTFLIWLRQRKKKDGVERLIFLSRDGYFLSKAYEWFCECIEEEAKHEYITISRQLAMTAAIETGEDFEEYLHMPYSGSNIELLEDRFGIENVKQAQGDDLERLVEKYKDEINNWIYHTKEQYGKYISKFALNENDAIVDLGFYGNNQKYLSKIAGTNIQGYYFNANLSERNPNVLNQKMTACFQKQGDLSAENSEVLKRMIFLESFLSAPVGMAKGMGINGEFIFAKPGSNQEYFFDKEEIYRGVKLLIKDYIELFGRYDFNPDIEFMDTYYGICFDGAIDYSDNVKRSFYNDNAMMNRIESQLFY